MRKFFLLSRGEDVYSYKLALLTSKSVVAYVRERLAGVPSLPFALDAELVVRDITDGNLNFAFSVGEAADEARAVFVKQAPGYIKVLGEAFKLAAERMVLESEVMQAYAALTPDYVPRFILRDPESFVMVTEYLHGYVLMRSALMSRRLQGTAAVEEVARFMAVTHSATWIGTAGAERWGTVNNETMCGITADYVFSKPLDAADGTNRCSSGLTDVAAALRADAALCEGVLAMRSTFLMTKQCLVHGDLHTGSVMVPADGGTGPAKVIDAEFAFFGPAAFDVGSFVANLVFAASLGPSPEVHAMIHAAWVTYVGATTPLKSDNAATAEMLQLACGFCGCELIRRIVGAAHVDDLEKAPEAIKLTAEKTALAIGCRLVKGREGIGSIDALLAIVQEEVGNPAHASL